MSTPSIELQVKSGEAAVKSKIVAFTDNKSAAPNPVHAAPMMNVFLMIAQAMQNSKNAVQNNMQANAQGISVLQDQQQDSINQMANDTPADQTTPGKSLPWYAYLIIALVVVVVIAAAVMAPETVSVGMKAMMAVAAVSGGLTAIGIGNAAMPGPTTNPGANDKFTNDQTKANLIGNQVTSNESQYLDADQQLITQDNNMIEWSYSTWSAASGTGN